MSTALYWGLPTHGVCLKKCRKCHQIVLVRTQLSGPERRAFVGFYDEPDTLGFKMHTHQPDPMWTFRWNEFAQKQRSAAVGRMGVSSSLRERKWRGKSFSGRDAARTKGTRVRGYDNRFRDCPFTEIDDLGEHI